MNRLSIINTRSCIVPTDFSVYIQGIKKVATNFWINCTSQKLLGLV